ADADPAPIELWNLLNRRSERWICDDIDGGWIVTVDPTARFQRLRPELPGLLAELEAAEIRWLRPEEEPWNPLAVRARDLGIVSASQSATNYPGSIYTTIELANEKRGGVVGSTG